MVLPRLSKEYVRRVRLGKHNDTIIVVFLILIIIPIAADNQRIYRIIIIGTFIIRLQCHIIIRGLSAPDFLALTYNKVSGYSLPQSGSPTHLGTRLVLPVCTQGNTIIDIVTKQKANQGIEIIIRKECQRDRVCHFWSR